MNIKDLLSDAVSMGASDIFIVAGRPIAFAINNVITDMATEKLMPDDTENLIKQIYSMCPNYNMDNLLKIGNEDFAFAIAGISRFRVSTYMQRNSYAAVIRAISFEMPDPNQLQIPETILSLADCKKGLVLVTGPAGSGKSTTLACMIDRINTNHSGHIITLEDPLEYLHKHKKSIVSQREIFIDCPSYISALKSALRQKPDVILLGEMRDLDTISVAMTAAETGHLILSSLHTIGAANTIDRILDVFPSDQQRQIAVQLAMILQAVVSQQLLPTVNGKLVPVFEVMTVNSAVRNMIRENKIHQLDNVIASSAADDMFSMDSSILKLYKQGIISKSTALIYAANQETLSRKL
ncbi:MAG: PilT/PilU family type 4a pilus ATPase [Oscillospiraceae bacterium]